MLKKVKVSYHGNCDYAEACYSLALPPCELPTLPKKGQILTLTGNGKQQIVKIKKRSMRREGTMLHVAFDVLELSNARSSNNNRG